MVILLFISGFTCLLLSFYSFKFRSSRLARYFFFLSFAAAIYAFGYGLELSSRTLGDMLFWSKIQYIGIPFLPALMMLIAITYTRPEKRLPPENLIAIFCIPIIVVISRGLNPLHHLFYIAPAINPDVPFPALMFDTGPFYLLHIFYSHAALIVSAGLLIQFLFRAAPSYRNQTLIMLMAALIQLTGMTIYLLVDIPWELDINPILFGITVPIWATGIFRFSLFDLIPVARDTVFENLKDGILVLDLQNRLIDFNLVCKKIFPELSKKQIGFDIRQALGTHPIINEILSSKKKQPSDILVMENNKTLYFYPSPTALFNEKNKKIGTIVSLNDITRQKELMQKMEKIASIDELTGIYNRRQLIILTELEIARARRTFRPISILVIDLDSFKQINDDFGHLLGDKALKAVTRNIKANIRNIDIFGRYGGDEFVVIQPETDSQTAFTAAERLRKKISETPFIIEDNTIDLTVSIGVFSTTEDSKNKQTLTFDTLLNFADKAFYDAKKSGRNKTVLYK
jgi:diguanylate cyclase (GGDEF)-like protein